jgi:hypothetical protein
MGYQPDWGKKGRCEASEIALNAGKGETVMTRFLTLGVAVALAVALLPPASPSADAAEKGKGKKGTPVATESLTIAHEGLKGKKPSSLKAKGDSRRPLAKQ